MNREELLNQPNAGNLLAAGFEVKNQGGNLYLWQRTLEGEPTRWILISDAEGESGDLSGELMVGLHGLTDIIDSTTCEDVDSAIAAAWNFARS